MNTKKSGCTVTVRSWDLTVGRRVAAQRGTNPVHFKKKNGSGWSINKWVWFFSFIFPFTSLSTLKPSSFSLHTNLETGGTEAPEKMNIHLLRWLCCFRCGGRWATTVAPPHQKLLILFFKKKNLHQTFPLLLPFTDPALFFEEKSRYNLDLAFRFRHFFDRE